MKRSHFAVPLFVLVAAAGCDKKASPESGTAAPAAAGDQSLPASPALATYESIRAKLAQDQIVGVTDLAGKLAEQGRAAADKSSGEAKTALDALTTAANALKGNAADIGQARKSFGEVSKHVVALLVAEPKLREGRHVFECPMAEGYKKWVQTKATIDNPYMGRKMAECGEKSDWRT